MPIATAAAPWLSGLKIAGVVLAAAAVAGSIWYVVNLRSDLATARDSLAVATQNTTLAVADATAQKSRADALEAEHDNDVRAIDTLNDERAKAIVESDNTIQELRHEIDLHMLRDGPISDVDRAYLERLRQLPGLPHPAASHRHAARAAAARTAVVPAGASGP